MRSWAVSRPTAGGLIVCCLLIFAPCVSAAEQLKVVDPAKAPLTVPFSNARDGLALGRVELLVRGAPRERLRVRFAGRDSGATASSGARLASVEVSAREGDLSHIAIGLTMRPGSDPADVGGVVIISADARNPADADRADDAPTPALVAVRGRAPSLSLQPAKAELGVTRWLGPLAFMAKQHFLTGEVAHLRLVGEGGGEPVLLQAREALLRSDSNGQARVQLRHSERVDPRTSWLRVQLLEADRAGTYSGALPVEYVGDGKPLAVSVNVQDMFVWPLLVLLLGAAAGGYGMLRYEQHRRRELLRAALKRAVARRNRVAEQLGLDSKTPYELGENVIGTGTLWPDKKACASGSRTGLPQLWCDIRSADGDDEFADVTARTNAIVAAIDRWVRVAGPFVALRTEHVALAADAASALSTDTEALLERVRLGPQNEPETAELLAALDDQRTVLQAAQPLAEAFAGLEEDEREQLADHSPEHVYARFPAQPQRTRADTATLVAAMSSALAEVRAHRLRQLEGTLQEERDLLPNPQDILLKAFAGRTVDERGAEEIVAGVRRWDWLIAAATALITAIAFLLPTYTKDTFGSLEDYVLAFCAGFVGQAVAGGLALNWQLFPRFRSYSPPTDTGSAAAPSSV